MGCKRGDGEWDGRGGRVNERGREGGRKVNRTDGS